MSNKNLQHQKLTATNGAHQSGPTFVYYNAVIRRVNRILEREGQVIRRCRDGNRYQAVLGEHYIVDLKTDKVLKANVNLRVYAVKYRVLKDWEGFPI